MIITRSLQENESNVIGIQDPPKIDRKRFSFGAVNMLSVSVFIPVSRFLDPHHFFFGIPETVWNPKSFSFSSVNERVSWNAPLYKDFGATGNSPTKLHRSNLKPCKHKTIYATLQVALFAAIGAVRQARLWRKMRMCWSDRSMF